jgi:hypothetical protein
MEEGKEDKAFNGGGASTNPTLSPPGREWEAPEEPK